MNYVFLSRTRCGSGILYKTLSSKIYYQNLNIWGQNVLCQDFKEALIILSNLLTPILK